jgi:hypothetical protein
MSGSKHDDKPSWITQFPVPTSIHRRFGIACIRRGVTRRAALRSMLERWVELEESRSQKISPPEMK